MPPEKVGSVMWNCWMGYPILQIIVETVGLVRNTALAEIAIFFPYESLDELGEKRSGDLLQRDGGGQCSPAPPSTDRDHF